MNGPSPKAELLLERLEWTSLRRLDGLLQGDYRSLFRGFGLDFAGLRAYEYGDEARHIDWNVTARFDEPQVRIFAEDRDITAWFLLDLSPSVDFGSLEASKRDKLVEFTALLARLLTRHGNRVGAIFFGGDKQVLVAPGGGRNQVLLLLAALLAQPELPSSRPTDLDALFKRALNSIRRRSLVFVVSDFFASASWGASLFRLARRHETVCARLFDPMESSLPDLGLVLLRDAETGEVELVDTGDRGFRARFAKEAESREAGLRSSFEEAGVDALELSTTGDTVDALVRFVQARALRARQGRQARRLS